MKEDKKVPQLRFPEFTDAWKQRKLGEIIDYSNGIGHENYVLPQGKYELVTLKSINSSGKLVCSEKFVNEDFETLKAETLIMMLSEQAKGMLGMTTIIPCDNKYVLNQRVAALKAHNDVEVHFLTNAINNKQNYFEQMGAGTKVQNITRGHVEECVIELPSLEEQKKIGSLFSKLEVTITLQQRKLNSLQKLKKGLLQKMFPKNGENIPEIRFPEFSDAWKQRKFSEVFEEYSEKKHPELPALTIIQGKGTILRDASDRNLLYDKANLTSYKLVRKDDFIVHLRTFEGGLEKANSDGIVSPAYHIFHGKNTDTRFFYPFFRSKYFIDALLKPHVYGIRDGKSIDIEGMKTISFLVPSFEEQNKIGKFVETLDNTITLQQRKLESLQKLKKGLLQQMFI